MNWLRNPELRRNIWLEASAHRLIVLPLLIGFVLLLTWLIARDDDSAAPFRLMALACVYMYLLITVLWGSRAAVEAFLDEVREKTWDVLRMSALTPTQVAFGKVFGASSAAWYGGAICLLLYWLCDFVSRARGEALSGTMSDAPLQLTVLLIAAAVLAQAFSALFGILTLRRQVEVRGGFTWLLLIFFWVALQWLGYQDASQSGGTQEWFGMIFPHAWFITATVAAFAAWALLGVQRALCMELQVRQYPLAWLGFGVFVMFYLGGFDDSTPSFTEDYSEWSGISRITLVSLIGVFTSVLFAYCGGFADRIDGVGLRRLVHALARGDWRRFWQECPAWVLSLLTALLCLLIVFLSHPPRSTEVFTYYAVLLVCILLACRDLLLLHFFALSTRPKRAATATLFYMIVLYGLAPWLLLLLINAETSTLLFPSWLLAEHPWLGLGGAVAHLALVCFLLQRRWRERFPAT